VQGEGAKQRQEIRLRHREAPRPRR
jgi:hypothetical protein